MGLGETKSSTGYGSAPWVFKGSALYQLHLVKAETARAFIPKEFRLVEAFGYTLGGFFLANYDDSPAGVFDELVVIAGIVWNPPTSCAWAARVLVNSEEACHHGRKTNMQVEHFSSPPAVPMVPTYEYCTGMQNSRYTMNQRQFKDVGLPSQIARFSKRITAVPRQTKDNFGGFLSMIGMGTTISLTKDCMDIQVTEVVGLASSDICNIKLITDVPTPKFNKWMGPSITMSLPSFSGQTEYNPCLLKYSCHLACRVRAVRPAKVSGPSPLKKERNTDSETTEFTTEELVDDGRNLSISVMLSKPILALEFNCLEMKVEAPIILSTSSLRAA